MTDSQKRYDISRVLNRVTSSSDLSDHDLFALDTIFKLERVIIKAILS